VASLLTARYPRQHGVVDFFAVLAPDEELLSEVLRAHG
jgi:arylsulfatase A-like enzyme